MNKAINITSILPKHLFWDVKWELLDVDRDQGLIIPRALFFSDEKSFDNDIANLERIYNSDEIVKNLKVTKEIISNHILEMVADRYHIPRFHRFSRH